MSHQLIRLRPALIRRYGLTEAAIIQVLHDWNGSGSEDAWTAQTYQDWATRIGVSADATRRALNKLRAGDAPVIEATHRSMDRRDRTLSWRIKYATFDARMLTDEDDA